MQKLNVALVGLGRQGTSDWIPAVLSSRFAKLVAICDIDKSKVDEWSKKIKVKGFYDYKEMLQQEDIDFLIIATPHHTHKEIAEEAIKRKIHVFKEKPFAMNLKEALYLKKLCEKYKTELMVVGQRRFNPIYNTFFQLKEQIGEPYFIECKYTLSIRDPSEGWRGKRTLAGGGCIIDMGYHMIDMLIWYFGLPKKILAEFSSKACPERRYDAEDTASILFKYKSEGLFGSLFLSRVSPPKTEYIKLLKTIGG